MTDINYSQAAIRDQYKIFLNGKDGSDSSAGFFSYIEDQTIVIPNGAAKDAVDAFFKDAKAKKFDINTTDGLDKVHDFMKTLCSSPEGMAAVVRYQESEYKTTHEDALKNCTSWVADWVTGPSKKMAEYPETAPAGNEQGTGDWHIPPGVQKVVDKFGDDPIGATGDGINGAFDWANQHKAKIGATLLIGLGLTVMKTDVMKGLAMILGGIMLGGWNFDKTAGVQPGTEQCKDGKDHGGYKHSQHPLQVNNPCLDAQDPRLPAH